MSESTFPDRTPREHERGAAAVRLLAVSAAVVALLAVAAFLLVGTLADAAEDDLPVQEIDEGALSQAAYEAVELGAEKEDVLAALLPVRPDATRVVDRFQLREPETVAAECVYFDREDGRAGEQYRFCFAEDVLVDKTVLLAGDPGEGSAVVQEGIG